MTDTRDSIMSRAGFSPSLVASTCVDCGGEVPAGAGWRGPGYGSFARASFVTRCRDCAVAEADALALFREYERRRAAALSCPHDALRLVVLDSAAGVGCGRCGGVLAACAGDGEHVPEDLWNRLAAVDSSCKPCAESRPGVCAFCGDPVAGQPPTFPRDVKACTSPSLPER